MFSKLWYNNRHHFWRIIDVLTDGRPMDLIVPNHFTDNTTGKPVHIYKDLRGRCWMAHHPWSLFRVETKAFI